ncbi:hypothetical protein SBA4_5940005 [Candidatus Sulfopaludibacter sp. SbA4]|nr:hypothetical protein SBA4_5940005 [Candidatus Sulfopaludibacter sp. SbA4]
MQAMDEKLLKNKTKLAYTSAYIKV